jgi:hypothetical protein
MTSAGQQFQCGMLHCAPMHFHASHCTGACLLVDVGAVALCMRCTFKSMLS